VDRMSALDASFFFAESENTPMHVGSVTVFEGPAPSSAVLDDAEIHADGALGPVGREVDAVGRLVREKGPGGRS